MLKQVRTITYSASLAILALGYAACEKTGASSEQASSLKVYLTDHPAEFDQVLVTVTAAEAKIDTSEHCKDDGYGTRNGHQDENGDDHRARNDSFGYWQSLDVKAGTYDVLTLRNGVDTLLATGSIDGTIRKIRITVSAVNVVINGNTYPVKLAADTGNYLYVRVHQEHLQSSGDTTGLWIDFDVSRSIVDVNGTYYLRPVLKSFCDRNSGGLEGHVTPLEAAPVVTAYNNSDTATAIPDALGNFRIRGLSPGIYTVVFDGSNGYRDTALYNVQASRGRKTVLPEVVLKK